MSQTITGGNFYPITIGDSVTLNEGTSSRTFQVRTETALQVFRKLAIREQDITLNQLGLFSTVPINNDLKSRFAKLGGPRHTLRRRQNGCAWNPKGKFSLGVDEFPTSPIEFQMEECPDAFWESCWERLFGVGNDVRDFYSTPEGAAMIAMMIETVYDSIGNDISATYHFANHPAITEAQNDGFYSQVGTSEYDWGNYYEQMTSVEIRGIVTLMDDLRDAGHNNYTMDIPDADIDADGNYQGDIEQLFEALIARAKGPFASWIKNGQMVRGIQRMQSNMLVPISGKIFPVILCTPAEYRAYEDVLRARFTHIPEGYRYSLTKESGDGLLTINALRYKGMAVVQWDEVATFDTVTGVMSHRVVIAAPGVFGISYDVMDLKMFAGAGLRITQKLEAPYMGKTYFDTTFRLGAGLADADFIVMASNIAVPETA